MAAARRSAPSVFPDRTMPVFQIERCRCGHLFLGMTAELAACWPGPRPGPWIAATAAPVAARCRLVSGHRVPASYPVTHSCPVTDSYLVCRCFWAAARDYLRRLRPRACDADSPSRATPAAPRVRRRGGSSTARSRRTRPDRELRNHTRHTHPKLGSVLGITFMTIRDHITILVGNNEFGG